jgi:hypothetical protein
MAAFNQHALSFFKLLVTWCISIFRLELYFLSAFILLRCLICLKIMFTLSD